MTVRRCTRPPTGLAAEAAQANRASIPVIETERLRLHAPTIEDLQVWTAICTDPGGPFGPMSDEEAWTEFAYYTGGWLLYGHGLFAVMRKSDRRTIGFVHLGLEWDDREPELGWMLAKDARGQGYATEAAQAARDWALQLLPGFVSYVDPANGPSNRVAERLGATRDSAEEAAIEAEDGALTHVWRHRAAAPEDGA